MYKNGVCCRTASEKKDITPGKENERSPSLPSIKSDSSNDSGTSRFELITAILRSQLNIHFFLSF